jgi:hypothetical protein
MVTELQFIAVALFLMWGLAASLCGLLKPDVDEENADSYSHDSVQRTKPQSRSA